MNDIVLGMPVEWKDSEDNPVFPLGALVIVKAVDNEGDVIYSVINSGDLNMIDCLGMAQYAVLHCENSIKKTVLDAED